MAPRKKNQTPAEQTDKEQKDIQQEREADQVEQTGQEQEADQTEQTGQEQETDQTEQTDQEQEAEQVERNGGEEDKPGKEPERDALANIPNPCVYCGPSVRGVARQYTTYQGGIPEPLKDFIKAHPAARRLIVPTAKFASVRKRLETPGTAEAAIYKKVKAEL